MYSGLFENLPKIYSFSKHIYLIYMYKENLALNVLKEFIWSKTQLTNRKIAHHFAYGHYSS